VQIRNREDLEKLEETQKYVLKPDMLFGKRGKRGLLGLGLSKDAAYTWLEQNNKKDCNIDGVDGILDVFLAEEMYEIMREHYLSFELTREGDMIRYSPSGGIDIEEHWENVIELCIPFSQELSSREIKTLSITDEALQELVQELFLFYRSYGFMSLEINPI
jgi:succinyl-CoA synthetase beta subunit